MMNELRLAHVLLVGIGGFVGSSLRFTVSVLVARAAPAPAFPWATLGVNVGGCLAIGLLAGALEARQLAAVEVRLLLMVGILGGFTTFSAFGLETLTLVRELRWAAAAGYVTGSLLLGLAAVWAGQTAGRLV